jgi:hypothetical protein
VKRHFLRLAMICVLLATPGFGIRTGHTHEDEPPTLVDTHAHNLPLQQDGEARHTHQVENAHRWEPFDVTQTVDLRPVFVEITQGIQTLTNNIELAKGRPTRVRVYVAAIGTSGGVVRGVQGYLLVRGCTGAQTQYALRPLNGSIDVSVTQTNPVWETLRNDLKRTLNFAIPSSCVQGNQIDVTVRINHDRTIPETNFDNNSLQVVKQLIPTRNLILLPKLVYAENIAAPSLTEFQQELVQLRKFFPVSGASYVTDPAGLLFYSRPRWQDPWSLRILQHPCDVMWDLHDAWQQASFQYKLYFWYGLMQQSPLVREGGCANLGRPVSTGGRQLPPEQGELMAHEIGHNLHLGHHGHAPTNTSGTPANGGIDEYGLDSFGGYSSWRVIPPNTTHEHIPHYHDIMAYTSPMNLGKWVSRRTYNHFIACLRLDRPLASQCPSYLLLFPPSTSQVRIAARIEARNLASVAAVATQDYLFVGGPVTATLEGLVEVGLGPLHVLPRPIGFDDEPGSGAYAIELLDADEQMLYTRYFDIPTHHHHFDQEGPTGAYSEALPFHAETVLVRLRHGTEILHERRLDEQKRPSVRVIRPNGGEDWGGIHTIEWETNHPDETPLTYRVEYSIDAGHSWFTVASDLAETRLEINAAQFAGSHTCLVRVSASDGANSSWDDSDDVFGVPFKAPELVILHASALGLQLELVGDGHDFDDGETPDDWLSWSSDRDGDLGSGRHLITPELTVGRHLITLTVRDSDENTATATTIVFVGETVFLPQVDKR